MVNNLETKLWAVADELRGNMDANEFKNYILGFIFYRFLSEKQEAYLNSELSEDKTTFEKAYDDEDLQEDLKEASVEELGYFIQPMYLYKNIVEKCKVNDFIINDLGNAFNEITNSSQGTASEDDFEGLFEDIVLDSNKLGGKEKDRNKKLSDIILHLNDIDFELDNDEVDILGDAYEYLISQFASDAGKKQESSILHKKCQKS